MWILVINAGSSSLKYSLFRYARKLELEERGVVEKIGEGSSFFRKGFQMRRLKVSSHSQAVKLVLDEIRPRIEGKEKLIGIGHRIVHGGERFKAPVMIDREVLKQVKRCIALAPLHNPPSILAIQACLELMKDVPQVAVFDTSFHHTIPEPAYTYALPYQLYQRYKIRKYGFHGTSHNYVAVEAAKILGKPIGKLKLISCHLGNGCSVTAIKNGKSIDTSMGFTPLEGLVMGTRSGDIDPGIVFFLMEQGYSLSQLKEMLNKKSGLLGLSGISNDMRMIERARRKGNRRAELAYQVFVYRLAKYIASYLGILGGADAIVFTAGIGENQKSVREGVEKILKSLLKKFQIRTLVIPTDEEGMIARETLNLLRKGASRKR